MVRHFMWIVLAVVMMAASVHAAKIVVLTEEPVAEFTLPDGKVLKNAFVWRRNSEGLMIIHDDGQFFLNYKTLPDAWRKAYAIDDSVGQVSAVTAKRYDLYSLYPILETIKGMPRALVTFLESERYNGKADDDLLKVCSLQSLIVANRPTAERLNVAVTNRFADATMLDLDGYYVSCVACDGKGGHVAPCRVCAGTGKCEKCDGTGEIPSLLVNAAPQHCIHCKGTGKCPTCNGTGSRAFKCEACGGSGKILNEEMVKAELVIYTMRLNAFRQGKPLPPRPGEEPADSDYSDSAVGAEADARSSEVL
ncbi:MAG: hypothetical protein JXR25_06565 [Pontiellaceae bacterium]|nr:hypothetical protein [Pontiellaceae bacterium]MBN2784472.1 hypothetical protein [Pontiellaceae bacterium]